MPLVPLPAILVEPLVRQALLEDLGRAGDITTDAIAPADCLVRCVMAARQDGVAAGLGLAAHAFRLIDPAIRFEPRLADGAAVAPGTALAIIEGPARGVLTAERTALNFVCRLSGIASATARLSASVAHTKARIVCTRKTTPLLRAIEKYAVRAGGGANHRFGLDDAALIKDNHVAIAGSVAEAIRRVRAHVGHLVKIEVEVDSLAQLDEALAERADAILLDNMSLDDLRRGVAIIGGRAISEASGRVTPETAAAIAETGVDLISVGWLTHSAPILDVGLDATA
ncbi:nicotinate-nucleotide pyrophosphorylase [carboxylating] [Roseiarcus fermentans]|uniref:Probable nicotinate-nucleotide pyrophosphorylase [carboxylating] n=1 Tax=Roseiarcus fermentans TaxID=1473586 RepID=A0A366FRI5_9HYPH|nr:carboxylating nicotinate-nucleotide diphosphorylase [Roseiarcus fermentans]RBP17293.1 nicotinate-nucleotide pyrophosphorylase [carboxylating] [Roseiarcus fermentans]